MAESATALGEFLGRLPAPEVIRQRIAENAQEAKLLRRLLRLAEQQEAAAEICERAGKEASS